jgi:transcriptional regulator with XRE-family HTH domain
MNMNSLGSILRDWRIERDLSQSQLGASAGLSRKIVGTIERGERKLDNQEIVRLCTALGRGVEELILIWSRSSLEDLRRIERELHGGQERDDLIDQVDQIGAGLQELYGRAQTELLQKLIGQTQPAGSGDAPARGAPTMR